MHIVATRSAFDLPSPHRSVHVLRVRLAGSRPAIRSGLGLLGLAAQGVLFGAVLWLLAAGPGFLSGPDSLTQDRVDSVPSRAGSVSGWPLCAGSAGLLLSRFTV